MSYDTFANFSLTFLFVAPLARSTIRSNKLRIIAIKAAIASFVGLLLEMINGFILFSLDGKEMIWVCLGACAADIVLNAILLYWAMDGTGSSSSNRSHSIHVSTIPRTSSHDIIANQTAPCTNGAKVQKDSILLTALRSRAVHMEIPEDPFSDDNTITSSECVPTLGRPKPVFRGISRSLCSSQHTWTVGPYGCPTCDRANGDIHTASARVDLIDDRILDLREECSKPRRWSA
ncbi:unnamed protein product [Rhizoctonia solani]|uniref:Uncharacterized protein n=1 Tax=Rhizoctonia solani TaxID=456999 RepID=A0A8H2WJ97_9AGAM|nr:unnamed protein product [Rhizoctonia solani]